MSKNFYIGAEELAKKSYVDGALAGKQATLVSEENIKTINGSSILGAGNLAIPTYEPFKAGWTTNSTTDTFCSNVNTDATAVGGMAYLGEVRFTDLPAEFPSGANADAKVEVIAGTGTSNKVIHLVITSGNVAPYRWEYTYWNNGSNTSGWVEFTGVTNYNDLSNIPVVNQDLDAVGFTPVASTYYRHTGASATTFTIGGIYYYDGTNYNAITGGGSAGGLEVVTITNQSGGTIAESDLDKLINNQAVITYNDLIYAKDKEDASYMWFSEPIENREQLNQTDGFRVLKTGTYKGAYIPVATYHSLPANSVKSTSSDAYKSFVAGSSGASWNYPNIFDVGTRSSGDIVYGQAMTLATNRQPLIVNGKLFAYQETYTNASSQNVARYLSASMDGTLVKLTIIDYNLTSGVMTITDSVVNDGMAYTTTAPSAPNTNGLMKLAVLSSDPATKYAGWLYYITA